MRIFLIGFMCAGKSKIGKKLAKKLNLKFIDLDLYIEQNYSSTIDKLITEQGEVFFRTIETEALNCIINENQQFVLACGGGTPCFNDNISKINSTGTSIYLEANALTLANRISKAKPQRPLLKNIPTHELVKKISDMIAVREIYYKQAKLTINAIKIDIEQLIKDVNILEIQIRNT